MSYVSPEGTAEGISTRYRLYRWRYLQKVPSPKVAAAGTLHLSMVRSQTLQSCCRRYFSQWNQEVSHKAAAEGISQRYPTPRLPGYLTSLHLKVYLSNLLLKVHRIFAPGLQAMPAQALQQAVFRHVEAPSIQSRRSQAVLGHRQGAHVCAGGRRRCSGVINMLVYIARFNLCGP